MRFFLDRRVEWERFFELKGGAPEHTREQVAVFHDVLQSLNGVCTDIATASRDRWHEQAQLRDGQVLLPSHIIEGYERLRRAGLVCLPLSQEWGGPGLPVLLNTWALEMIACANASLMTLVGLQTGVAGDIEKFGSEELKQRYLPRFASGELQGSMDLTEPHAGSDLGAITTRVTERDGRFFVDGEKIFITNGGSPVHLVLARDDSTYEKSKGTALGLSLVLCPTTLPDGTVNRMRVGRVERKIGLHGSATCSIELEQAEGFLLGRRGNGFRAMLELMNNARLGVAAQALGIAHAALAEAHEYAAQRIQFGAPIIEQPLVKMMLADMTVRLRGARASLYRTAAWTDRSEALRLHIMSGQAAAGIEAEHKRVSGLVRFLTALCKYHCAEVSNEITRQGIQIHGGSGYLADSRAAQHHADAIVTTIYEGTSEIQASFALQEMRRGLVPELIDRVKADLTPLRPKFPRLIDRVYLAADHAAPIIQHILQQDRAIAAAYAKHACDIVIDLWIAAELLRQADCAEEKALLAGAFIERQMPAVEMKTAALRDAGNHPVATWDRIPGREN